MEKKDLVPSYDNICSTFCDDSIGRNEELLFFVSLLNSISGPYSIAVDGRWGSGKTFFVKQAKMLFDVHNPFSQLIDWNIDAHRNVVKETWVKLAKRYSKEQWEPSPQLCVYFDAWEYDSESDPIATLLYQIARVASSEYNLPSERNPVDILGNILDVISGRNIKDLLLSLKSTTITDDVTRNLDVRSQINAYFTALLPEHGDRLIIFIDELDRCAPSYAVKLLERIKHYFINDKITFVFSLNMEQMQHTIRQHYGSGFDAHKYIERFFDLPIPMPPLKRKRFNNTLPYDTSYTVFQIADAFAQRNHMEMREITRYYSALNMVTQVAVSSYSGNSLWFCYYFLLPVALGLQKTDISKYHHFLNGEDSSPLIDLLSFESVFDYASEFFKETQEDQVKTLVEKAYSAILVDGRNGKSNTIQNHHYNETTYDYFSRTISFLSRTTVIQ